MTQELTDLRNSILEGRYEDALDIVDELEAMSKKDYLRKIRSYLVRLMVHLIKNQVEGRLTNSWAVSIRDSLIEIQDLNLKDNKKSHYINVDEWDDLLENTFEDAVFSASAEVAGGVYKHGQLLTMVDENQIRKITQDFLGLTYVYSGKMLRSQINENLSLLPGGEEWNSDS